MDIKVAIGEGIAQLRKVKKLAQQKFSYEADIERSYLTHVEKGTRNGIDYTTQRITRKHNQRVLEIYSIAIDKWMNKKERLKYNDLPENLQILHSKEIFLDRYKVVDLFRHSHNVVARITKDGRYYIYPDLIQVRSISVCEAARIKSLPDNYYFEGIERLLLSR